MSKIDIIRRIANTTEGRSEMGLPDEKIQVSEDGDGYSFIYTDGYIIIPESKLETVIIRNILVSSLPEDYKIEITQVVTEDNSFSTKCSIHNIRNHHTLSFSYGASHLEATGKCLIEVLNLIKNNEVIFYGRD